MIERWIVIAVQLVSRCLSDANDVTRGVRLRQLASSEHFVRHQNAVARRYKGTVLVDYDSNLRYIGCSTGDR